MQKISGKKLFKLKTEAPAAIKAHVEEDNPGISDIKVNIDNGIVSLSGNAESAEATEKAILLAGNVKGGLSQR